MRACASDCARAYARSSLASPPASPPSRIVPSRGFATAFARPTRARAVAAARAASADMRAAVVARRGVRGACAIRGGCDGVWRSGAHARMRAIGAYAGANGVGLDDEVGWRRGA